jgi:hypothetical protein
VTLDRRRGAPAQSAVDVGRDGLAYVAVIWSV